MVTIFPSAKARLPDLYNLIRIHAETRNMEELVLAERYIGGRELTITDTTFTDSTVAAPVEFDNQLVGTQTFANTNTAAVVDPGETFSYNEQDITFKVIVDGSETFANSDVVSVLSANGNLALGTAPTVIALTNTMTLNDVVDAINDEQSTTGIQAIAASSSGSYFLRLQKDNTTDASMLLIDAASTAGVLTDLGLTADTYVITLDNVVSQIGGDASVNGAGPYALQLDASTGLYVQTGTALSTLGFTANVNLGTNTITMTSHGFTTGDQVTLSTPGTLPIPFDAFPDSFYFIIRVDDDNFRLATTRDNALASTSIDITIHGTDYFTVKSTTDSEMYYQVWKGYRTDRVFKQRMDEVIAYFQEKQYTIYRQTNPATDLTMQWVIKW